MRERLFLSKLMLSFSVMPCKDQWDIDYIFAYSVTVLGIVMALDHDSPGYVLCCSLELSSLCFQVSAITL